MSNSNLVNVKVPAHSNNYTVGRSGRTIEMITIHHMSGILTAEECGRIFQDGNRKASSHYGIGKDGKIALYVDEENTAYTNGDFDANCKAVTIETSNSEVASSYPVSDEVLNVLIKLVADIAKRNNLGTIVKGENLTWHKMHAATNCPGEYLLSKMDYIIEEAHKINNEPTSAPSTPTAPIQQIPSTPPELLIPTTTEPEASNKKSNEEIVNEVIAGKWGNGEERKNKLTQAGYDFSEIQAIVNEKLSSSTPAEKPNKKSNEELAQEVIKGEWGNGEERKRRLTEAGYNFSEIQTIVNNKLSEKSSASNKKSNEEVANEVIKGKWGNGEDRKNKLIAAGYDYVAIQKIVNDKLK